MEHWNKAERSAKARGLAAFLLIIFLLCLLIALWALPGSQSMLLTQERATPLSAGWKNGQGETIRLPAQLPVSAGQTVELTRRLPQDGALGNSLLLRTSQQTVEVLLNGESVYLYEGQQGDLMGVGPCSVWHVVRLPEHWVGAEITLRVTAVEEATAGQIDNVMLGYKAALLTYIVAKALPALVPSLLYLLAGVVLWALSVLLAQGAVVSRLRWLGSLAVATGLWSLLETRIFQLYSGRATLHYALVFTVFSLLPVCAAGFFLTYSSFAQSRLMRGLFWLSFGVVFAVQILQLSGLTSYRNSITLVHIMLLLLMVGILRVAARSLRRGVLQEKPLYIATSLFAAFGLLDMFRFYAANVLSFDPAQFSRWGFLFFILVLTWVAVRESLLQQRQGLEREMLQRLAYTDALTGLLNRTAFEQAVEPYRTGERKGRPFVLLADMNGLKQINDTLGHLVGDEALSLCGLALKSSFEGRAACYRVGGDEFLVLGAACTESQFARMVRAFEARLAAGGQNKEYNLSMACGWCQMQPGETIDEVIARADRQMYEKKSRMRGQPVV